MFAQPTESDNGTNQVNKHRRKKGPQEYLIPHFQESIQWVKRGQSEHINDWIQSSCFKIFVGTHVSTKWNENLEDDDRSRLRLQLMTLSTRKTYTPLYPWTTVPRFDADQTMIMSGVNSLFNVYLKSKTNNFNKK